MRRLFPCRMLLWWTVWMCLLCGFRASAQDEGTRDDMPTNEVAAEPMSPLVRSFEAYQRQLQTTEYGLEWVSVGPVVNSARVEAVQLDPARPGLMYAAFGSGGLWKTTNNGMSWRSIFDNQPSYGIGDFALAPSNPDVIYLGTGESLKKARNFTIPGTGIYRSDDGGESWRSLGLHDSWHVSEIAVHPTNPDIALVAVLGHFWSTNPNRGLYRTEDGGKTWQHVLRINDRTGANDVVWARNNTNVVYASTWENNPDVSGVGSGVYKSDDAGITWKRCEGGLPSGEQIGRIGLAVSHSNSDKVYALVDNRARIEEGAAEIFSSIDGGQNWSRTHEDGLMIFSRIGWYFADLYVNPQNDDEIFGLGVRIAHSVDGGKTFDLLSGSVSHLTPSAASGLHLDHCEMWIDPTNPEHMVLGNDGGLYQSFDKGESWLHHNNLPTGEFYDIAVTEDSPYQIFAGAQDNATVYGLPIELTPDRTEPWKYLWIDPWNGGDGCVTQVDPLDSNTVYYSAQEGAFRRKDMTTNRSKSIQPRLPKDHVGELRFNFVAPLIISPHASKTLYMAGNYVFKSTNRGDDWTVISDDIAVSSDADRQSISAGVIAESPLVPGLLYVGTDRGVLWVSEDDGHHWEERSGDLPKGYIRSIVPSRFSESRVYAAVTGLNYDDLNTYLYCSEDWGGTWQLIAGNISEEPANVIIEDPLHEDLLYAGTFRGVYVSADRGGEWSLLGRNLPPCSVADLVVQERVKDLVIATHGRGVYTLNLAPVHEHHVKPVSALENNQLYPVPTAVWPELTDVRSGPNFRDFDKLPVTFWLTEAGDATLRVLGEDGEVLATFVVEGTKGLNQFRWDLVVNETESNLPYFVNYKSHLKPGSYRLQLEIKATQAVDGKPDARQTLEQPLTVIEHPSVD